MNENSCPSFLFLLLALKREYRVFSEFFKREFHSGRNFCCNTYHPHLSPVEVGVFLFPLLLFIFGKQSFPGHAAYNQQMLLMQTCENLCFGHLSDACMAVEEYSLFFIVSVIWANKRQSRLAGLELKNTWEIIWLHKEFCTPETHLVSTGPLQCYLVTLQQTCMRRRLLHWGCRQP